MATFEFPISGYTPKKDGISSGYLTNLARNKEPVPAQLIQDWFNIIKDEFDSLEDTVSGISAGILPGSKDLRSKNKIIQTDGFGNLSWTKVANEHINDASINAQKLALYSITSNQLGLGCVTGTKIRDKSITNVKIKTNQQVCLWGANNSSDSIQEILATEPGTIPTLDTTRSFIKFSPLSDVMFDRASDNIINGTKIKDKTVSLAKLLADSAIAGVKVLYSIIEGGVGVIKECILQNKHVLMGTDDGVASTSIEDMLNIHATRGSVKADLLEARAQYGLPKAGDIRFSAAHTSNLGWLLCNGAAVGRTQYPALFAAIGITYGAGDGSTTFNVPNFNDRFPMGCNNSGTKFGGANTILLESQQIPPLSIKMYTKSLLRTPGGTYYNGVLYSDNISTEREATQFRGSFVNNNQETVDNRPAFTGVYVYIYAY